VGFGQTYKKWIGIERRAKNIYKIKKRKKVIDSRGPKQYLLNLKLKKIPGAKISYNAGWGLCNFTMYTIMDYIKKQKLKTKFGFIHIPKDYGVERALKTVKKLLSQIKGG
jgi:pyrrolidone-carboxylate peptidase